MKVMMVIEGEDCALRIEPEDAEGRALLARFGVEGVFETRLGPLPLTEVSAKQWAGCYEGVPAELD